MTSPDWALEDREDILLRAGSYQSARKYFLRALTKPTKNERLAEFGKTFETLGRVIHHIQDMAQPQHTRLDLHLKISRANDPDWFFERGSRYEKDSNLVGPALPCLSTNTCPDAAYMPQIPVKFTHPRKYWIGGGTSGMAEFSNKNFVSHMTQFRQQGTLLLPSSRYALPVPLQEVVTREAIEEMPNDPKVQQLCGTPGAGCKMRFVANDVVDSTKPVDVQSTRNSRAATLSFFDQDLKRINATVGHVDAESGQTVTTSGIFALNSVNFREAQKFLIPRALHYSAGLIDYFFRGAIDMVQDFTPGAPFQYRIKNESDEPLRGTFALYYDDASEERRLVKQWDDLTIPARSSVVVNSFDFSQSPAPRVPGQFLLVFNGDLGEETRAEFETGAVMSRSVNLSPLTMFAGFRNDITPDPSILAYSRVSISIPRGLYDLLKLQLNAPSKLSLAFGDKVIPGRYGFFYPTCGFLRDPGECIEFVGTENADPDDTGVAWELAVSPSNLMSLRDQLGNEFRAGIAPDVLADWNGKTQIRDQLCTAGAGAYPVNYIQEIAPGFGYTLFAPNLVVRNYAGTGQPVTIALKLDGAEIFRYTMSQKTKYLYNIVEKGKASVVPLACRGLSEGPVQ